MAHLQQLISYAYNSWLAMLDLGFAFLLCKEEDLAIDHTFSSVCEYSSCGEASA